jgi:O-acetyl-ADP-ribose deacetylase (regulator of RNase III)
VVAEIHVVVGDITRLHELGLHVDAIVNAANSHLAAGSGVCGAIFAAAGARALTEACDAIGGCPTGSAVATPAFALAEHGVRHIVHAVGPVWHRGGGPADADLADAMLASAYRSALEVAADLGVRRIAFPAISTGIYGFPPDRAARVAVAAARRAPASIEEVVLVAFDEAAAAPLRDALAPRGA